MVWTDGETLTRQDIEEALLPAFGKQDEDILNRPSGCRILACPI